jgi:Cytochrome c554 and c-prime
MLRFSKLPSLIALSWLITSSFGASFVAILDNQHRPAASSRISLSTKDRLEDMVWWPTKGVASRSNYVGTEECAKCHSAKATSQVSTEMAQASTRPAGSNFLHGQTTLDFRQSAYTYKIEHRGDAILYSARDRESSLSQPLFFAFGEGVVGQTYIYQVNGNIFESRLSYYSALKALDLTTGHLHAVPPDLQRAMGRLLKPKEAQGCFGCHTTASTTSNHFVPSQSFAGVTCEGCHGPGSKHVSAMKAGRIEEGKKAVLNPGTLDPVSSVDFCGACHRAWADVIQMGVTGVATVRFQPYRLEESRCWGRVDKP